MSLKTHATLIAVTRRYVDILVDQEVRRGTLRSKAMDACVGDRVAVEQHENSWIVEEILPRKNCLVRSYDQKTKRLAANLDMLFIVTAIGEVFNTVYIDRVLSVAQSHHIPVTLLVNKADLTELLEASQPLLDIYRKIVDKLIITSAIDASGIDELRASIESAGIQQVAFTGVSGVGKSSLINKLIPELALKIRNLSKKTGQGRQTTSQAVAYQYLAPMGRQILLIDLPGIQSFGVTHLDKGTLSVTFPEMRDYLMQCQFKDCLHRSEENCAVIAAVECGKIPFSRYKSYIGMLEEIDASRKY